MRLNLSVAGGKSFMLTLGACSAADVKGSTGEIPHCCFDVIIAGDKDYL